MSIIKMRHRYDYGHDWYVQIINTGRHVPKFMRNFSLIQLSFSWNDYGGWPYIQIKSGTGCLLSIMFWVFRFGFDISIIDRTWDWDYIEKYSNQQIDEFLRSDEC